MSGWVGVSISSDELWRLSVDKPVCLKGYFGLEDCLAYVCVCDLRMSVCLGEW